MQRDEASNIIIVVDVNSEHTNNLKHEKIKTYPKFVFLHVVIKLHIDQNGQPILFPYVSFILNCA